MNRPKQHLQILFWLYLLAAATGPYAKAAAQESSTLVSLSSTTFALEQNLLNSSLDQNSDDQLLDLSKTRMGVGIGYSNASVVPNTDNKFNDGRKLSLGFGLSIEYALAPYLALTARADLFMASGYTIYAGVDASLSASATAGFIIGKLRTPGQFYFTATAGPGAAIIGDRGLDDEGEQDCLLCTTKEGGTSAGLATRLAIGRTGKLGQRIELVYMRTGGNGNNSSYTNDEEAFIDTFLIQISGGSSN